MKTRRPLRMLTMALASWALLGFGELRRDEVECESAIAHLQDCCPDDFAVVPGACDYGHGCGTTYLPILAEDQSLCIQELSCGEIEARDLCREVAALLPPSSSSLAPEGSTPEQERVCR